MAVVKLKNKEELDKLVASLTLRLGRKVSQQDILKACIELSTRHLEDLADYFSDVPKLTKERVKEIVEAADDFEYDITRTIDQDIYGDK